MCSATLHNILVDCPKDILEGHSLIWTFGLDSTVAPSSSLFNAFASWERFHNKDAG